MRHPFFRISTELGRPLVFAHRGGGALAPENTFAAFDNALALGVDGLELDVHLSRDGVAVVHHDRMLDRTTNLTGPIARRTTDELSRADAGYRFEAVAGRPFRDRGFSVPTLGEVFERYPDANVIVELKVNSVELARAVVAVVQTHRAVPRVCLGSFGSRVLRAVRTLAPTLATSAAREEVRWALYRSWCRWPVTHAPYGGFQVPEHAGATRVVSPRFVADAHRAGLGVQVWTVDTERDARRLVGWGVDALITDRPDVIVPLVEQPTSGPRSLNGLV